MASRGASDRGHIPVLGEAVRTLLAPALGAGRWAVDSTFGRGGHTAILLETGADVIALDQDTEAVTAGRARFGAHPRLHLVHASFADLPEVLASLGRVRVDALVADLGVSSPQLDDPRRGFSFQADGPLDMRMDPSRGRSLAERLSETTPEDLAEVLRDFGEERHARRVARAICEAWRAGAIDGTATLARVVAGALPTRPGQRLHPATRTFQALRIWVNGELEALDALLGALPEVLAPGGRAAVVSFHSLEDRRVKQAMRALCRGCVCPPGLPVCTCGQVPRARDLTRRPRRPNPAEVERNPRARSARLRAIEWLAQTGGAP
ncbi:MAG: 16S rRNA (cytosine(1402)-N(4))-methyltransferase RsmH [Deltaproteobacteria bacterium]|nr:MAG: 16S rRNA (cytosine(1402)-N(4))-methyltransferase RsmH [Deltaproteobacteria bacterium]